MEKKEIIDDIMVLIHKIADKQYSSFQRESRKSTLIAIRDKITEYKDKDNAIEAILIYLGGFISGLNH